MATKIEQKIAELVSAYGYEAEVLSEFAAFVQSQPKPRKRKASTKSKKPKAPTLTELKKAVCAAFNCKDYKELKKNKEFQLAIADRKLNFSKKESWLILYREWVGVPANERNESGPTAINGIDVLKNFRPWAVFELDSKTATAEDINQAFKRLAKQHHPDVGGDRLVFEELKKMRDSILAFR